MKMSKWKLSDKVWGGVVVASVLIYLWHGISPEFAKFVGYLIGGCLVIAQIIISNRRATAAENTASAMQQTAASTEKGNIAERFKNAIEHLGHESASVRLGGIYALHHLAQENADYRKRVFEILCAHVRETTTNKAEYKPRRHTRYAMSQPSVEIESVLKLLFDTQTSKSIYTNSVAKLPGSNLEGAVLRYSNLLLADLSWTNIRYSFLQSADLTQAFLFGATMAKANVKNAVMKKAQFGQADLSFTNFEGVDLQDANFKNADCRCCDFLSAKNLTAEQLLKAYSLHKAKLPENIKKQIKEKKSKLLRPPTAKKKT